MIIRNKFLYKILNKVFGGGQGIKRVHFEFINENIDDELSELAFLNQTKMKFDESSDRFKVKIDDEIERVIHH